MLEVGLGESKYSFVEFAQEDNFVDPNNGVDLLFNLGGDEGDGIFMPILGEEAIEVDHLLVEPYVIRTLEDNLSPKNVEQPLNVGDMPFCAGYYNQGDHCGIFDAGADQVGKQALKYELVDGTLQGVQEDENLHVTCKFLCDCSGYLLNNSLLDYPSNGDSAVTNIGSGCQIQFLEKEGGDDISTLHYTAQSLAIGKSDHVALALDSMNVHELHDTFHSTGWDASLGEQKGLKNHMSFDQRNMTALDVFSNLTESGLLSNENEDNMILISENEISESVYDSLEDLPHSGAWYSKVGATMDEHPTEDCQSAIIEHNRGNCKVSGGTNNAAMTTKRLRKPTRRYIEETPEMKRRCSYDRFKTSLVSSKNNRHHERTEHQFNCRSAMQVLYEDCLDKVHSSRGHQRKHAKRLQDERLDEKCTAIMRRRKHHRQWTLSEVIKLVDGVSQYGVGRWTEIKRLLFSTSAYRTAVDLKDKWRNLLRASVMLSENRNLLETWKSLLYIWILFSILSGQRLEVSVLLFGSKIQKAAGRQMVANSNKHGEIHSSQSITLAILAIYWIYAFSVKDVVSKKISYLVSSYSKYFIANIDMKKYY